MHQLFAGRTLYIATMHGKEQVIVPLVTEAFWCSCALVEWIDTDQFGTFTREVKRPWDMLFTARAKIRCAMEKTGADLVIASEWSFGPYRAFPLVQANYELTVLYDRIHDREILGHYETVETNLNATYVSSVDEALAFAESIWFPEHGIIVRRRKEKSRWLYKEIPTKDALIDCCKKLFKRPLTSKIYLETDMRAHKNPTRLRAIAGSTKNLIEAASCLCPECQRPWFVVTGYEGNRICVGCWRKTEFPTHQLKQCQWCHFVEREVLVFEKPYIEPSECSICNP